MSFLPALVTPVDPKPFGWLDLGMEYTCVPDVAYPWDAEVLKAIWEFDPGVIPIWIRWKFKSPAGEVVVFGRHGFGRWEENPSEGTAVFKPGEVHMPDMPCQGVTFHRPNVLIRMFEGYPNKISSDLPGDFVPWDWRVYHRLRKDFLENETAKEHARRVVRERVEKEEREKAKRREEHDYIMRDFGRYMDKEVENLSDVEIKELQRIQAARRAGIRTRESTPFVDLGR